MKEGEKREILERRDSFPVTFCVGGSGIVGVWVSGCVHRVIHRVRKGEIEREKGDRNEEGREREKVGDVRIEDERWKDGK